MHAVAILEASEQPRVGVDDLARAIGGGITALELRMATSAVTPSLLLRTPSRERAEQVARAVSCAGHWAEALDLATVTPVERMVRVHRFRLDDARLHADERGPAIAYADVESIIHVAAETSVFRTTWEKEREPSRGVHRATEVDVERTRTEHVVEHAAFLVGSSGTQPWVLRAGELRYLGLGGALRPTTLENFQTLLAILRSRAPRAAYDDRFAVHPIARHADAHVRGHETAAPKLGDEAVDVRVHLVARLVRETRGQGPYR